MMMVMIFCGADNDTLIVMTRMTIKWMVMIIECVYLKVSEHLVQNSFPQALQFWDQKV